MKYQYKAVNSDTGIVTGSVDAENSRVAVRMLRRQGLNVVDLKDELDPAGENGHKAKRVRERDTLLFMRQFCTLLSSGVSLEEAVVSLSSSAGHPGLVREFGEIAKALRRGESFSDTLGSSQLCLPDYFHPLTRAGELTGKLSSALEDGLSQWEYDIRTANELRNALTYPVILIVSGIAAVLLIFALVVPRFVKLLDRAHGDIPLLARIVLGMGSFVNDHSLLLMAGAIIIGSFAVYACFNPNMRQRFRDFLAGLPLLKTWMTETEIGRWSAMMATLLENRVELLNALELSQKNLRLTWLCARLSHISQSVRNGASLAAALQDMNAITATGYNLIRVGERSGKLPQMLRSLAELYTESGRNRMKRFLVLIEPAAILIIGAVVGFIMAGIILAITSVNEVG